MQVKGAIVPNWDDAKDLIITGADLYQSARIIGWDLVITDEKLLIIETSGHPGVITPQFEAGLLEDPVAKRALDSAK